jgi:hypothetical protein
MRGPCESVAPELGYTLIQVLPFTFVLKVVPGMLLAIEIPCPAGESVVVALKVSDVGVTLSVDTAGAVVPPLLPGATRLIEAVWELVPSEAVTVAL